MMEYVSGWRDLNAAAQTIREVLERQLSVTAVWAALTDDEQRAVLEHTSNNLAQLLPSLGEVDVRRAPTAEHAAVRR